jgi:hypothetical protein
MSTYVSECWNDDHVAARRRDMQRLDIPRYPWLEFSYKAPVANQSTSAGKQLKKYHQFPFEPSNSLKIPLQQHIIIEPIITQTFGIICPG